MWIWNNTREHYFCSECYKPIKWTERTGFGVCNCRVFIPDKKEASVPPRSLKGKYKKRVRKDT